MEKKYMHTFLIIIVLLVCIAVAGMNYFKKSNEREIAKTAISEFLEEIRKTSPEAITCIRITFYTEGGADSRDITDGERIKEIYPLLCDLSLGEETQLGVLDDGMSLEVEMGEEKYNYYFEGNILVMDNDIRYEVNNMGSLVKCLKR